ncbi:hypothetical protein [Mycolicibacter sinensis]|jgi:hypothetical protein|uniref:Secreted protein n=1 Tax=Mycolicibacter sinensis (strain JDM601) TaxID=875328 RepID=A0A1A2EAP4_MYCSD|nr:hypothetical protein [Mycolicibacter sinensis]OBG02623.1 hypothetical protein A5772_07505 [Mycolicibacter sinensis]OBG03211.1 hypothetical protein A5771_14060 [Mycolicibacter sinensis]
MHAYLGATAALMAMAGGLCTPATAAAVGNDFAINGTFAAVSDGQFATTDYAFHGEQTVRSTWTIESACTKDRVCGGQVTSDAGWSALARSVDGRIWKVERDLPGWQICPDGSTSPGHQTFTFYPSDSNGVTKIGSPYLEGRDKTTGVSGACGTFKFLTVVMPFRLDRIG